ncbi:carbohydrate ABC transporter permease [Halocella sp. SP3-1]|uniref:carbohydrate ABC transporter permease n=1 Tax=Halocella sp. SP3-1 TaxID=2382161 RepID=UPI000F760EE6|nr:carbohydrate ABC transporter permease [Halocella sp. SP3-1]AZO94279.1 carbohydrate ABC transporter permease [Halocella sp. SP3-1]MTI58710.1 carbohydrate ABC transporter permease [Bacillota bacterium]
MKKKVLLYILNIIVSLIIAFPFIWLVITSLKTYDQIYSFPILYWPKKFTFEHYTHILKLNFPRYFLNSVVIGCGTAIISILIAVMPAYASARYKFKGKKQIMLSILLSQMFPQIVYVVPFFIILKQLNLQNSYLGMMVSYLPFTTPIAVWMIRSFFLGIPDALEEAAMIDGCNRFKAFYKIYLPLAIPGIASVGIYAFLFSWSELMFSMSFLSAKNLQTVPVFLSLFVGQYQTRWGPLFAGSVVASIPPMLVFALLQKYFIQGLTSGSVKN